MDKGWYQDKSKDAVRLFLKVEDEILYNAAKKLGKDRSLLTKEDFKSWEAKKLEQLASLNEDNLETISKYAKIELEEVKKMLTEVGFEAVEEIEGDMLKGAEQGLLFKAPSIKESESLRQILNAQIEETKKTINQVNNTMLKQVGNKYRQVLNDVNGQVAAGIKTPDEALRSAVKDWADKGIPALIDKGNRQWSTEAYVNMVMRSSANNVANGMQDERMAEYGNDLIEVSSHGGARPLCAPYQGRIFSLSGKSDTYPAFSNTSYGEVAGLFGINCGHFKYPYIAGITEQTYYPYDKEENDKIYEESQKQRYHERQIRSAKNEQRMMKGLGDKKGFEQAKSKVRNRQASMRDFIDRSNRTRRYDREQII